MSNEEGNDLSSTCIHSKRNKEIRGIVPAKRANAGVKQAQALVGPTYFIASMKVENWIAIN